MTNKFCIYVSSVCLYVGPYNTSFRNLKNHLKMTLLHDLLNHHSSNQVAEPFYAANNAAASSSGRNPNNLWATIWDVNSCLEAVR